MHAAIITESVVPHWVVTLMRGGCANPYRSDMDPTKGEVMPFINVKIIEGVFDGKQKQEIIRKLTDAMVSIEGENMRPVT